MLTDYGEIQHRDFYQIGKLIPIDKLRVHTGKVHIDKLYIMSKCIEVYEGFRI